MKNLCLIILLVCTFCACKEKIAPQKLPFEGTWVYDHDDNMTTVYRSAIELDDDSAGYIFKSDGRLIVRQNVSDCGLPPAIYAERTGTWKNLTNDTIAIQTDYRAIHTGNKEHLHYKMYVVSSDAKTLKMNITW